MCLFRGYIDEKFEVEVLKKSKANGIHSRLFMRNGTFIIKQLCFVVVDDCPYYWFVPELYPVFFAVFNR